MELAGISCVEGVGTVVFNSLRGFWMFVYNLVLSHKAVTVKNLKVYYCLF